MVEPVRETPERWELALRRAIAESLDVLVDEQSGQAFVESTSRPGLLHAVSRDGYSCEAGKFGNVCKHQAAYRAVIGELALPESEPTVDCTSCCGCGVQDFGRYALPCDACGGSGVRVDHRLRDVPAVEVFAAA